MPFSRRRRVRPVAIDPATGHVISPWPFVGLALIVSGAFLYGVAWWLIPVWAALVLTATWFVMFVLCFIWWMPHPKRVLGLGVGSFVWWFVAVTAGGVFLGWLD